jgi:hypothetical protein
MSQGFISGFVSDLISQAGGPSGQFVVVVLTIKITTSSQALTKIMIKKERK